MSSEFSSSLPQASNTGSLQSEQQLAATTATAPYVSITHAYDNAGDIVGDFNSGATVDDTTPTLYGQTTPNGLVRIYVDNFAKGYVTADASGNWSFTLSTLSSGSHTIKAELLNSWAKVATSENFIINIGVAAPVITSMVDDVGLATGNLTQNDWTDDARPEMTGTAIAGHLVKIYDGTTLIGSTVADASGIWRFTPASDLSVGTHNLVAQSQTAQGNMSAMSAPWAVTVVAPPSITHGYDDAGGIVGNFTSGATVDDASPALHGRAAPGSLVKIYVDNIWQGNATADATGNWSYQLNGLSDGKHTIAAELMNGSKLVSKSSDFVILIDTTAPDAPTLNTLPSATNENPVLGGTGTAGETIVIRDNGREIGTAIVGGNGTWSFIPNPALSEGKHSLTAEAKDAAGNVSAPSAPGVVLIDTTAPDAPTLNTLPGATNENPVLGGTGTAGETIIIRDNGREIGTAIVGGNGTWSFTPTPALSEGKHSLTAEAVDAAGNVSKPSAPGVVLIDTTAPDAPTLNALPGMTNENPILSGTGTAGETIVIRDNGREIGTAVVGGNGTWSFTPNPALSEGEHRLTVEAVDGAGNVSQPSAPGVVVIDTSTPDTPTLNTLPGATNENPILSGTGKPGETIVIRDNGREIGTAIVGGNGTWSFIPNPALSEGKHSLTAEAKDAAGNVSQPSAPGVVLIDTIPPDTPTLSALPGATNQNPILSGTGTQGETIIIRDNGREIGTVIVGGNGTWSFTPTPSLSEGEHRLTVEAVDAAGNVSKPSAPGVVLIDTTAPDAPTLNALPGATNQNPPLSGTGTAGETIVIRDNGSKIGTAVVGGNGTWSFIPKPALSEGKHSLTAEAVDAAGNVSKPSAPGVVLIDTTPPDQPVLSLVDATNNTTPPLAGSGLHAGERVIIYDNGVEIGFTTVGTGGNWSFTPTEPMSEGEHSITIVAVDQAGNASIPSEPEIVLIDITPPDRPTLTVVSATTDTTPTLTGGGLQPGERVIIRDSGIQIGRVVADHNGNWSFTPTNPMAEGNHTFTIVVLDAAGNASVPSEPGVMLIDSIAPTQRTTVTFMTKDTGFSQSDLTTNDGSAGRLMQGTLSSALSWHERLQVSTDGGSTWLDAVVNGTDWAAQDNHAHDTSWTIQTRVVDMAGNVGVTDSHAVTLAASAPAAPKSLSINDNLVKINLQGSVAGDKVLLVSDQHRVEHVLTEGQIYLGYVQITLPFRATTAYAAIESKDGSISTFTHAPQVRVFDNIYTGGYGSYQFTETQIAIGKITATPGLAAINAYPEGPGGDISGIVIGNVGTNNGVVQIDFRHEVKTLDIGLYSAQLGKVRFQFYDTNGKLLADLTNNNGNSATINFKAGTGAPAAYMKIVVTGETDGFSIDQIIVDFVPVVLDPNTHEIVNSFSYVGNAAADTFVVEDTSVFTGFTGSIEGGKGTDILKLTGAGQLLDLSGLGNKMNSVEVIDITGTGNNTLKLSLSDVLGQGSMDLFHASGDVQMMVKGNAGDTVMLDDILSNGITPGAWSTGSMVKVEGVNYVSYQYSTMDAELLVQQGVHVNLV